MEVQYRHDRLVFTTPSPSSKTWDLGPEHIKISPLALFTAVVMDLNGVQ